MYTTTSSPPSLSKAATQTKGTMHEGKYILDPHSAIGIAASIRSGARTGASTHHISLATAHPAKFSSAVEMALGHEPGFRFETVLPDEFVGLEKMPRRCTIVKQGAGWEDVRGIVREEVEAETKGVASAGAGEMVKG